MMKKVLGVLLLLSLAACLHVSHLAGAYRVTYPHGFGGIRSLTMQDGTISFRGCNTNNMRYNLSGEMFSASYSFSTKIYCSGDRDLDLVSLFQQSRRLVKDSGTLTFYDEYGDKTLQLQA